MHENNYSYYTITRIKKNATILKKEKNITHKQALDVISKARGFKSFKDANNLYENWLKQLIKNESELNKMIKLIPNDNIILEARTDVGQIQQKNILNVNMTNVVVVENRYDKGNINYHSSKNGSIKFDSTIQISLASNDYFNEITCYFKDSQNEYHRILRELGIKEDT